MAWAYKRKDTFYAGWTDAAGEQQQVATKARTLTEARKMAEEKERIEERVRLGLDKPAQKDITFAAGTDIYLESLPSEYQSRAMLKSRLRRRILPHIGARMLRDITPADIRTMLAKNADLSPQSREHLRIAVQGAYTFFIKSLKRRDIENPAAAIGKVKIPRRDPKYLTKDQLRALYVEIADQWKPALLFAVGTAVRKGELTAILKSNVHLTERVLVVATSNGNATTKTGQERRIPIPEWLVPHIEIQLKRQKGRFLFARPDGTQWSKGVRLAGVVKSALGRAGMVTGWTHCCRRKGCAWRADRAEKTSIPCPNCGFKSFAIAIPINIRWKDLRSTWATQAAAMTGDIRFVQSVLGHGDLKTTLRYAFALPSHMQVQANKVDVDAGPVSHVQATNDEPDRTELKQAESGQPKDERKQLHAK